MSNFVPENPPPPPPTPPTTPTRPTSPPPSVPVPRKFQVNVRTTGKVIPPQLIRMKIPGWGGMANLRMENGSEPQPWHCPPFVDAATYGLELIYPYETPCNVFNRNGEIEINWDPRAEPGAQLSGREFGLFPPKPNKFYLFQTGLDIEVPQGYAIRVEPHPRFYTDDTGTVPPAVIGHVQTEWWSKTLFCVFKVPASGQRHLFRKGEPYAAVILVPHAVPYEVGTMDPERAAGRAKLDRELAYASPYIAKSVWFNKDGDEFRDHYRIMERAYSRGGQEGLDEVVNGGVERFKQMVPPPGTPIEECLSAGLRLQQEGHFLEARTLYQHFLSREPNNDQALSLWSVLAAETRATEMALQMMRRTVELRPDVSQYHANLGRLLLRTNRAVEAEPVLRKALELSPNDPKPMSDLAVVIAQQGRVDEGMQLARRAVELAPNFAFYRFHVGVILANTGRAEEARAELEKALEMDPNLADARRVLDQLPGAAPPPK